MTLEPYLEGPYVKHSDNMGHDLGASEVPAAFSWFTYAAPGGSLVVCDVQGVGARFTDPQVHSRGSPQQSFYMHHLSELSSARLWLSLQSHLNFHRHLSHSVLFS